MGAFLEELVTRYCLAYESYMDIGGFPPAVALRETIFDLREEMEKWTAGR